jgi:SH3 domain-containing YSC84-like protein 1
VKTLLNKIATVAIALCVTVLLGQAAWAQNDNSSNTSTQNTSSEGTTHNNHSSGAAANQSENSPDNGTSQNSTSADTQNGNMSSGQEPARLQGSDIEKRIQHSAAVLDEIMKTPDKGIPDKIMDHARCIVVIPSEVHIAFGFGGQHGRGIATCRNGNAWSAPAPVTITGGSWGLQFGGEAVDLVMMIMSERGADNLLSAKFKIGAGASAAAGPIGREISAGTSYKMNSEILTYARSRGIFAGIDLNGSVIEQDKDSTRLLYGKMVPFADILKGKVPTPKGSGAFEAAVEKYYNQAKDREQHAG